LALITDILDLTKIESGTITVEPDKVRLSDLVEYVEQTFRYVAQQRHLAFHIEIHPETPEAIVSDAKRLQQVLRNLLSNAFKFTEMGSVKLRVHLATEGWHRDHDDLNRASKVIAFSVIDTGIGIAEEKQHIIFEAFQQADGTTSRRYGGTGLGLSISRELAKLLGGELRVTSRLGEGSVFTLYLGEAFSPASAEVAVDDRPTDPSTPSLASPPRPATAPLAVSHVSHVDDRQAIQPGDPVLLIISEDVPFAQQLLQAGRRAGFRGVIAGDPSLGTTLAMRYHATAAVIDTEDTTFDGWWMLDQLKRDIRLRHLPVTVFAATKDVHRARRLGAFRFVQKPVTPQNLELEAEGLAAFAARVERRLLVADKGPTSHATVAALSSAGVHVDTVDTASAMLARLGETPYDCVVVDQAILDDPDVACLDLRQLRMTDGASFIALARDASSGPSAWAIANRVDSVVWPDGTQEEQLLAAVALHLHTPIATLAEEYQRFVSTSTSVVRELMNKKVLVIDDDVRNIFAMTSALERHGVTVLSAENGPSGLQLLDEHSDVDAVMVDIMMPEMDGYEVMRRIHLDERFRALPVIAVTAKAMNTDRDKCIAAGATDYVAKPVDMGRLLTLLKVRLLPQAEP
jgi:CheY-like chemotaxis protein